MRAGHVNIKPVRAQFVSKPFGMAPNYRLLIHPRGQLCKVFLRQFRDRTLNFFDSAHAPKVTE